MTLVFHVIIDFHDSYNSLVGHCQLFRREQEQVSAIQMWYTDWAANIFW